MDQHKLRTLVFEKTGVRIDVDDPVFALVALNEAVLAEAVERHVGLLREASAELAAQVATLKGMPVPAGQAGAPAPAPGAPLQAGPPNAQLRAAVPAAGAAVLGALLVLGGQALLFKPAPAPAPVIQARELTPEQVARLDNADKLARAIDRLDRKTRAAIAAEMQKP
jgi:hypothetical protein